MKSVSEAIAAMLVVVVANACGGGPPAATPLPPAAAMQSPLPAAATPTPDDQIGKPEPLPPMDLAEVERARRQAEAQAYLDHARDGAETRHRGALDTCARQPAAQADACAASADEALEAELRAARVEFDQQMMRGE